jgi:hypothetical protein
VVIIFNQSGGGATILAAEDLVGSVTLPQNPNAWYFNPVTGNCNWKYRKMITIDHTKVSADQSSFPVLVSLTDTDLSAKAQSNGNDILFTSSDGTFKLNHEIENYTSSTGSLVAWVGVPTLSSATDTVLYLYYGNSTATSQQFPTGVWDANFMSVWHLNATSGGTDAIRDSTSTGNHGTNQTIPTFGAAGKIGNAITLDGVNNYISTKIQLSPAPPQVFTESLWFKTTNPVSRKMFGSETRQTGNTLDSERWDRQLYIGTGGYVIGGVYNESSDTVYWVKTGSTENDGAWHYAALTFDSSTIRLYVDGSYIGQNTSGLAEVGPEYWRMGGTKLAGGSWPYVTTSGNFTGSLDEVQLSNSVRSAQWIATEYANQNSPSTFYSVGNEEQWWKC